MSIKLIAIDIDGTLLNSKREITPRVKAALNAASAQGVYVVLCTTISWCRRSSSRTRPCERPRLRCDLQRNTCTTNRFEKSTRSLLNDT